MSLTVSPLQVLGYGQGTGRSGQAGRGPAVIHLWDDAQEAGSWLPPGRETRNLK